MTTRNTSRRRFRRFSRAAPTHLFPVGISLSDRESANRASFRNIHSEPSVTRVPHPSYRGVGTRGTRGQAGSGNTVGTRREHEGTRGNTREYCGGNTAGTRKEHGNTRNTLRDGSPQATSTLFSIAAHRTDSAHEMPCDARPAPPRYMWGVGLNLQGSTSPTPAPHVCDGEIALDGGSIRLVMRESDPHAPEPLSRMPRVDRYRHAWRGLSRIVCVPPHSPTLGESAFYTWTHARVIACSGYRANRVGFGGQCSGYTHSRGGSPLDRHTEKSGGFPLVVVDEQVVQLRDADSWLSVTCKVRRRLGSLPSPPLRIAAL